MTWLLREVREMEIVPRGYGIVRPNYATRSVLVAPIPLNLLMRWTEDFMWWLACAGVRGGHHRELERMWRLGCDEGRKHASALEYDRGRLAERERTKAIRDA